MIAQADNVVDDRPKNFLTEAEITSFLKAARKGRHGIRNYAMALLAYRHGLRVSELLLAFNRQSVRAKQTDNDFALFAWRTRVLRIASKKRLKNKFDPEDITDAFMRALASFSRAAEGPSLAMEELENIGIAVVIEPHLPRTHLDGAAMNSPNGTLVIGLTLRYDRLDNFFFCLFHELGHVVKHIATDKAELFLDDLDQRSTEKLEKEADAFARQHLVPEGEWQQFWEAGDFTPENVRRSAKRLGIHGAILAGRVRREKNDYQILSGVVYAAKIRQDLLSISK